MDEKLNQFTTSDFLQVLLALERRASKNLKVASLARIEKINDDNNSAIVTPFPIGTKETTKTIQCYYLLNMKNLLEKGDIVVVLFLDKNFIQSLQAQLKGIIDITPTYDTSLHKENFGIIIGVNKQQSSGVTDYNELTHKPIINLSDEFKGIGIINILNKLHNENYSDGIYTLNDIGDLDCYYFIIYNSSTFTADVYGSDDGQYYYKADENTYKLMSNGQSKIGDLNKLQTTAKNSVVDAINEVKSSSGGTKLYRHTLTFRPTSGNNYQATTIINSISTSLTETQVRSMLYLTSFPTYGSYSSNISIGLCAYWNFNSNLIYGRIWGLSSASTDLAQPISSYTFKTDTVVEL